MADRRPYGDAIDARVRAEMRRPVGCCSTRPAAGSRRPSGSSYGGPTLPVGGLRAVVPAASSPAETAAARGFYGFFLRRAPPSARARVSIRGGPTLQPLADTAFSSSFARCQSMPSRDEIFEKVKLCPCRCPGRGRRRGFPDGDDGRRTGAESIDFLDIVFRLEKAFGIKIRGELFPEDVLSSTEYVANGKSNAAGIAALKAGCRSRISPKFEANPSVQNFANTLTVEDMVALRPGQGGGLILPLDGRHALVSDRPLRRVRAAAPCATAVKNVSLAEEHMHDHFPGVRFTAIAGRRRAWPRRPALGGRRHRATTAASCSRGSPAAGISLRRRAGRHDPVPAPTILDLKPTGSLTQGDEHGRRRACRGEAELFFAAPRAGRRRAEAVRAAGAAAAGSIRCTSTTSAATRMAVPLVRPDW